MKKILFLCLLLLTGCNESEHITEIFKNEHYFAEWQNFAEPYAEGDELLLDEINEKIDNNQTYYKATVETSLATISAFQGTDLLWEDLYRNGENYSRRYHLTGGPYYFAELNHETPYEMIGAEETRMFLENDLPCYEVTFIDPLTPLYTIKKIGPTGEIWIKTINSDSVETTWLTETLPESTHTIDVVIPEKGATLPKKLYTNTDYGFSFEFPAYAFPLYEKNGVEIENPIATEVTVTETRVSTNESEFTLGSDGTLTVLKLKTGTEQELNEAIKEHWGYFCSYVASVDTETNLDIVAWNTPAGVESSSCPGGNSLAWYSPETKTLFLNDAGQLNQFGYNDQTFSLTPDNLQLLQ